MSSTLISVATVAGSVLAGYTLAVAQLCRAHRALRRAAHAATHDDTTGLPNRRALSSHLAAALRERRPVAVAMLDLDRFKTVNDALGHDAGDDVLRAVATRLAALPPPVDLVARLQGDEFVLLIDGDAADATVAAQAAWEAVSQTPIPVGDGLAHITASIGVALASPGIGHRQLLHHADLAMYQAKTTGTGVCTHTPGPAGTPLHERPRHRDRDRDRRDAAHRLPP